MVMAVGQSITSVNAVVTLTIANLYPTPQQLQGWSAEDIYDFDDVETVETQQGIDGVLAGGYVIMPKKQKFYLLASSASCLVFEAWKQAQDQVQDVYIATGSVILTSVARKYTQTGGFLTMYSPAPTAKRTLQRRMFEITWQTVLGQAASATAF
jgi:hypothetical protein